MRKLFVIAMLAAVFGAGVYSHDANAATMISVQFQSGDPAMATLQPAETATLNVILATDVLLGIAAFRVGVGAGASIIGATSAPLGGQLGTFPMTDNEPANFPATVVGVFGGAHPGLAVGVGTFTVGTITVRADNVGTTNINPFLDPLFDNPWFDTAGNFIYDNQIGKTGAVLNVVPEPTTVSLLGLGLVGLVLLGRRIRS